MIPAPSAPSLLLSFYGDDFTGSTDVMEALSANGVETVLYLDIPDAALLQRFAHCRALGIAGTSRSESPAWMEANLVPVLAWLKARNAAICHYKVCSTFDSSPATGNIGKAVEIGRDVFEQAAVPLLVGAPQLRRYTVFGTLFAAYRGEVYRLDRHPVMSRHPVTPMREADLRLHLKEQSRLQCGLVDAVTLRADDADSRIDRIAGGPDGMILFDVDDAQSQRHAGRQLWRLRRDGGWFVAGSSGVEYALLAAWRENGLAGGPRSYALPGKAARIAVVSGSVSPTTESQIRHALANGFKAIALDPLELLGETGPAAVE
ncbi:MAG: four-carbon acid sugar kinase family protein, partial [Alphaproteobacteria bacterium]